ncbi:hypothetical protein SAMN05444673_3945 [Bacillus sp. OV166]|uniref:hypothetical protein n=1 Tax=Bacillus sp. OV166 TaxID=1882763 RepID=UPI000A2AA444|nr:hypothetical protein [Bacillus sp. OV166]SMQ80617.1 hypothetical protein SAMN05444673_3945 [Bacillus sp. OV166]
MSYVGFNKKMKGLFYVFLLFLVIGWISLKIADSINYEYDMVRDNFVNQIDGKDLSNNDIKKIENSLQTINEKFHTSESIAIYVKKDGINDVQYFDLDLKNAEYLFPIITVKKDNLITEGFQLTEGIEAGKYYIVHRYIPDWYYLFPVALFTVSGVLFLLWLILQIKYIYTTRLFKLKLN